MRRLDWRWGVAAGLCGTVFSACAPNFGLPAYPAAALPTTAGHPEAPRPTSALDGPPAPVWPAPQPEAGRLVKTPPAPERSGPPAERPPEIQLEPPADLDGDVVPAGAQAVAVQKPAQESALVGALRCLVDKRPNDALARLRQYDPANQELLMRLLPLAVRFTEGPLAAASPEDVESGVDELESATRALQGRAPLRIENMCFCRRIDTFGVYEPLPGDHRFRPGDLVEVYVELRNFTSQRRDRTSGPTTHVIALASSFEIRDYAGKVVHYEVFHRKKPDESRTQRHDYFDNYRFYVPAIPPGAYTLVIRVEDLGTRPSRKAKRSLDFWVTNLPGHGSMGEPDRMSRLGGGGP